MQKNHFLLYLCAIAMLYYVGFSFIPPGYGQELFPEQYPAQLRLGTRGACDAKTQWYYTDLFIPVYNYTDSALYGTHNFLFFVNPKFTSADFSTDEQNIGAGVRYLSHDSLFDEGFILGANIFYDSRYTYNGVRHNQAGAGIEFLSHWFDLRSNYYHPLSNIRLVDYSFAFGEESLLQFLNEEEALPGVDAEIGILVPFISHFVETRIYGGKYWYTSTISDDITGTKARLEINPSPFFCFNLETKHDPVRGRDNFIGGYISIPFDIAGFLHEQEAFSGIKEALRFRKGPRELKERLTEPVVRDIDIVSANKTRSAVVHNVVFVNNANTGDSLEDGSFSHPHNTLAEAFSNSRYGKGVWIFVAKGDGTGTGYTGAFTLADQSVLWGDGYQYLGLGGAGYPVLDGSGADCVTLGKDNTVMGVQIQNGHWGIYGENSGTVAIHHTILTGNDEGIKLLSNDGNTLSATISDSSITNSDYNGIELISYNFSTLSCTLTDNDISDNTYTGVWLVSGNLTPMDDTCTLSATFLRNTINNNTGGVSLRNSGWDHTTLKAGFSNNTITGNSDDGIFLENNGYGTKILDLGNGSLGSAGYNSIHTNSNYNVSNESADGTSVMAENNWWGSKTPLTSRFHGSVDYTPWLTEDPN
ncbi:MAG: inverse autotransporter beta domain-containing protein [Candidatus Omnitrophica bacterium]|nr:inverse autotransporter beta domain-containing protein [Candidatus Omnitrophota bacterium]